MDTGGAIQLFTVRNFVNFFLGIGWGGVCFSQSIHNTTLLALVARAEAWLRQNGTPCPLLKWETERWGEIPADFGRK